jgi:signal transduction histidine kinase
MRLRLVLSYVLVVLVTIVSILLLVRQGAVREVGNYMTRAAMGLDDLAADLEVYYQQNGSWEGATMLLANHAGGRGMGQGMMMGRPHLRLADARGDVVADSRDEPSGKLTSTERGAAIVLQTERGEVVGYLVAEASSGMMQARDNEQQLLDRLVRAAWIAATIAGGLALLLALLLSYGLLQPVVDLTRAAAKMANGDLSQRVQVKRKDELGTLGAAFNHMAASLQRAEQNRRAMTADIAHELRTPIAIQRAHLEALQDGVYPLTAENLQPVLDQTELLARLVDDLRTLALADSGELKLEMAPLDLSQLAQRVIERFRPEAEMRGVNLVLAGAPSGPVPIHGDANRIEQVLNNLISNALRHTPLGGQVSLRIDIKDGWVEMYLADTGPGIPPEALPRVFERFYRADKSRSREEGGTGLGLAIARQLAVAHGGDIRAANRPEGGAEFTVRLPVGSVPGAPVI